MDALRAYNRAVRWGAMDGVTEHVAKEKRAELLAQRKEFGELQIVDCEVGAVNLKGKQKAVAVVRIDWYLVHSLRLRTSFVEQKWQRRRGAWKLTNQRLVRGAPYPLLQPGRAPDQLRQQAMWPSLSANH